MMPVSNRLKNQHLLYRAGFGPMTAHSPTLDDLTQKQVWEQLFASSMSLPAELAVPGLSTEPPIEEMKSSTGTSDDTTKKLLRKQARENLKALNITWLNEMIHSAAQFRERMSLFWHGHFACRVNNAAFQQQFLHAIRTHATGNFADLLKAVSKSPAMLRFLNNQQNRKLQPNENFAREVMELFTMGTGTYSETDVKEAARAFTGWGFNLKGEFVFREKQHDGGKKTFLGRTGTFNGDDILNILLEQK